MNKVSEDLAMCAQVNFQNLEDSMPQLKTHPYYVIAKSQLDEALGVAYEDTLMGKKNAAAGGR